jgi:large subunit ribosomal protein L21
MYAIIQTGGKQYRVSEGDVIDVELLGGENNSAIEFKEVLFVGGASEAKVGAPLVNGFVVKGELLGESKGPKVVAFKYKRRKQYRRKVGHRQRYSQVKILKIAG